MPESNKHENQPVRPAATVIIVRDAEPQYEIFMLRRTNQAVFAGGMYVFPGGRVDEHDHSASYAPFLQRFSIAEKYLQSGLLNEFPNLQKWADALVSNTSVQNSVAPEFFDVFEDALKLRGTLAAENRDAR